MLIRGLFPCGRMGSYQARCLGFESVTIIAVYLNILSRKSCKSCGIVGFFIRVSKSSYLLY